MILCLPRLSVLDIDGKDASAILHNLTTNQIKSLEVNDAGVETFITNVKGKCLGHVIVFRTSTGFRLIGAGVSPQADTSVEPQTPPQSQIIAEHVDRYTIREDAIPTIRDDHYNAYLFVNCVKQQSVPEASCRSISIGDTNVDTYAVPWVQSSGGRESRLILVPASETIPLATLAHAMQTSDSEIVTDAGETFHRLRIASGFPWYGVDIDQSHLPQEVGRESQTISFNKGCYLGQETVARLDALGQVQKKLVAWSIVMPQAWSRDEGIPQPDTKLFDGGEKAVGRLTSVAAIQDEDATNAIVALGYARRSHFEPGATATGVSGVHPFVATVLPPQR